MASDKRQFDDFTKFDGEIKKGVYKFPTLTYTDTHKHNKKWEIFVRLIAKPSGNMKYGFDWDINKNEVIPIKESFLKDAELPSNAVSQIWTETGVIPDGKISRSAPTFPKPKNVGRANERNYLKQALVEARAKYLKQKEKSGNNSAEKDDKKDDRYFPMLARNFKDEADKVKYPVMVQPKLDGMRSMAFLKSPFKSWEDVVLYSRNKKDIEGFDALRKELFQALKTMYLSEKKESLYIDGELYQHGLNLQAITGIVRNIKKNNAAKKIQDNNNVKFYVFDAFYPSTTEMAYTDRLELLNEAFDNIETPLNVCVVPTQKAKNKAEIDKIYDSYINDKYEGVMIKNPNSPYLTSLTQSKSNIRSRGVLKLKGQFDAEYKIVDFTEGNVGKDVGAIIWVMETKKGNRFNATPKNTTYQERYNLYKKLKEHPEIFKNEYKNKMATVEYQDLSDDGVPLRAKWVGVRYDI